MTQAAFTTGGIVARKRTPPNPPIEPPAEPSGPSSETVRIDVELMRMVRFIVFVAELKEGKKLRHTDYFDALVRAPIRKDYDTAMAWFKKNAPPSSADQSSR